jgi:hypothetical protein
MAKTNTKKQMINAVIKNSANKIKKQGGSPSEISNKRKTVKKVYKDATRELKKLFIPASSKKVNNKKGK